MKVLVMDREEIVKYKKLLKEEDLVSYLLDKSKETKWFYEKYLYFINCVGDECKYADACLKMMKEDIDEFYSGRKTNNIA